MNEDDIKFSKKLTRKGFLKSLFNEIAKPVIASLEAKLEGISGKLIRPPGARTEIDFLATCTKCHNCVKVCPVYAIRVYRSENYNNTADPSELTPYILPNKQACDMCKDMPCITSCKSGALIKLDKIEDMRIGVAIPKSNCLRNEGIMCVECINRCPIGESVLFTNKNGSIDVNIKKCTGCGKCEYFCPNSPKSIVIEKII